MTTTASKHPTHVEERDLRRADMHMRVLLNRAHRHARFTDLRVGSYEYKRDVLDHLAATERLRKVFTLVEHSACKHWKGVGFHREGHCPGLFRSADAYVMARLYAADGTPANTTDTLQGSSATEAATGSPRKPRKPQGVKLTVIEDGEARQQVLRQLDRNLQSLPFSRSGAPDLVVHARASKRETWVCAEINPSFGHATLDIAPAPTNNSQLGLQAYAAHAAVDHLASAKVTNLFALSRADDQLFASLYADLGFRVTGHLAGHLRQDNQPSNTLLWHRRVA